MRMIFICLLLAGAVRGGEMRHDFRGGRFDDTLFRYEGPTPEQLITREEQGLRWRFVAGNAPARPVGLCWREPVRGGFVVTAHYEVLRADGPDDSSGPGVELYLMLDGPGRAGIAFSRHTRLTLLHLATSEAGQRVVKGARYFPTIPGTDRGRLRLAREGATLIASLADGDQGPFREVDRADIGEEDVRMVRFAGVTGGDRNVGLDMRLLEFSLETPDQAPQEAGQPPPADAPAPPRRLGVVGGVVAVVVAALALLFASLRRPKVRPNPRQA